MFPRLISSSNRDAYQFALMFGRDRYFYLVMGLAVLGGAIATFFEADAQSLLPLGLVIVALGIILPMLALYFYCPINPWSSVTSVEIRANGTMEVSTRLFGKAKRKKKTLRLTFAEKRKDGYYLGTSFTRSIFLPFGAFGHEDMEFLDSLVAMVKNKAYPER